MQSAQFQSIQWFPGHMHKASQALKKMARVVDVYIELLDARIPLSSTNPLLNQTMGNKPRLRVMAKMDLADAEKTAQWQAFLTRDQRVEVLSLDGRKRGGAASIPGLCRKLLSRHKTANRLVTAMVVGIPNVGKSTLINSMAGKVVAPTGDQPALTRGQQFVEIDAGFRLLDTPGLVWPKIADINSGYHLAMTGAIRDTALPHTEIGIYALTALANLYPDRLAARYGTGLVSISGQAALTEVGRRRGCLVKGGAIDLDRAAKIVIADIRNGHLGRLTWELPETEG